MDKVLLIDLHNAIWRANVRFGPSVPHQLCQSCISDHYQDKHPTTIHCQCGSPWHEEENFCYGDKYLIVYNFFRNLRPIIELFSPDKCFCVQEGHPQFRYDLYSEYKANRIIKLASRQEAQNLVMESRDIILPLLQYLPITLCRAAKYEADDTIGTLCENMKEEDLTVLSADTDYIQLLQRGYSNIKIYNPIKKEYMASTKEFYIALKSLRGDKSDNIKRLVSDKKAISFCENPSLLEKFLSIEENRANFSINKRLVEFASVPEEELEIIEGSKNFILLREEFSKMKFESIINQKSWEKYCKTFDCLKY